ncbi:hypothetical protein JCM3774_000457 [Rhodotorula dairenensis]
MAARPVPPPPPPPPPHDPTSRPPAPDLPHELLVQIIHYAAPPLATDLKFQRRRRRPLRRYALVNKAWHAAALDEASQHLFINLHSPGWAQSADVATERILTAKKRVHEQGRNVKTLAVFGEKHLPDSRADVLRTAFEHAHLMTLQKMKRPMRLLAGSEFLTSLRLYQINTPHFIGAYPSLQRLELIDCFAEAFIIGSWVKRIFPVVETAVFQLKARRHEVPLAPPNEQDQNLLRPDTVRALALAGPFQHFLLLELAQQANLEHLHIGTTMEVASHFLSSCRGVKRSLSLDPNGAGLPPLVDQTHSSRVLASSDRFSRVGSIKVYNAVDTQADPWFLSLALEFLRLQTARTADFEYALHTASLSLPDWDPLFAGQ